MNDLLHTNRELDEKSLDHLHSSAYRGLIVAARHRLARRPAFPGAVPHGRGSLDVSLHTLRLLAGERA